MRLKLLDSHRNDTGKTVFFRAVLNSNQHLSNFELRFENFPLSILLWFYFQLFQNFFTAFVIKKFCSEKFRLEECQRIFILLPEGPNFASV
jgi:hypothetical protein